MRKNDDSLIDSEATVKDAGKGTCPRCYMLVARYAPQVVAATGIHHRECFEAWYFSHYGRRPALLAGINGDRHLFRLREKIAA